MTNQLEKNLKNMQINLINKKIKNYININNNNKQKKFFNNI